MMLTEKLECRAVKAEMLFIPHMERAMPAKPQVIGTHVAMQCGFNILAASMPACHLHPAYRYHSSRRSNTDLCTDSTIADIAYCLYHTRRCACTRTYTTCTFLFNPVTYQQRLSLFVQGDTWLQHSLSNHGHLIKLY